MTTKQRFWTHRLLWRLRGGLMWPAFFALTLADAVILTRLPPVSTGVDFVPGLIISSFANLFLIGLVGPWLARRLLRRDPQGPPFEVLADRAGSVLLAVATVGIVAAGLAARPLVVVETEAREQATAAFSAYLVENGTREELANEETANTERVEEGLFRICIALNDRTRASCYFVDTDVDPPSVTKDGDARPNQLYFQ